MFLVCISSGISSAYEKNRSGVRRLMNSYASLLVGFLSMMCGVHDLRLELELYIYFFGLMDVLCCQGSFAVMKFLQVIDISKLY